MLRWASLFLIAAFSISATPQAPSDPVCPSSEDVQAQVQADKDQCLSVHDAAQSCCSDPSSCSSGMGGTMAGGSDMGQLMQLMVSAGAAIMISQSGPGQMQDMSSLCGMFGGLNGQGGQMNGKASNQGISSCTKQKTQCDTACGDAEANWKKRAKKAKDAGDCDSASDMLRGAAVLGNAADQCDGFVANTSTMRGQAGNMSGASQNSMQNVCSQLGQQPQMQQLQALGAPQQMTDCTNPVLSSSPECQACQANNNGQPCATAIKDGGSNSNFQPSATAANAAPGNFAVPAADLSAAQAAAAAANLANRNAAQQAAAGDPMAAMMGRGGGAILNTNPRPQAEPPVAAGRTGGFNTAIFQGERSGGYSTGPTMEVDASNAFQGYGNGNQAAATLDLKKYLPGHRLDPRRKIAGVGSANPDINSVMTDIFKRISDRFKVICSSSRLRDCEPVKQRN